MSSRDEGQLRLLRIFHYLLAAIQAVVAFFPVIDLAMGLGIVTGRVGGASQPSESYGWALIGSSIFAMVLGLGLAILTTMAGRRLAQRRAHSFCMFVAAINCLFFPFGTIVGVFTLIVLKRPQVQEAFGAKTHHPNVAAWEGKRLP